MNRIVYTGGAKGADACWTKNALENGFKVIVCSFEGHKVYCNHNSIRIFSQEELNIADQYLLKANEKLKRKFPTRWKYTNNLLRRNYYIIHKVDCVYAVGSLSEDKKSVMGGTGWGVQMAIDFNIPVLLFEQNKGCWYYFYDIEFKDYDCMYPFPFFPPHQRCFACIGTRDLTPSGEEEIKNFLICSKV